ncbi:MAG TPA: LPS-assembly protein LptD, partial [Chromatiales bacterium]|nr:LPS-assembly protein LptD [Chromatiales bacterium]
GVTGLRAFVTPMIARPFDWKIFELTPELSLDHTIYRLNGTPPGQDSNATRTAPIMSLDLSTSFERYTHGSSWLMTLEPRFLYTYIPFRNQDQLPVFDTVDPDLNMVQLFRKNRFVGHDRIADTNQVALGLTSRLIGADDGVEFLRLTMGQLQFLSAQEVTLPGEMPDNSTSSDYIAEFNARLASRWSVNAGFQWNSNDGEIRRTNTAIRYQRDARRIANLGYRFRRDSLEEIDVSVGWPIGGRWNFVGRYNYSLLSNKPLERFVALEYETCCWAIRGTWRRNIVNRAGDSDTSVGFQVVLKGLSDPGTAAEDLLGRGILTN